MARGCAHWINQPEAESWGPMAQKCKLNPKKYMKFHEIFIHQHHIHQGTAVRPTGSGRAPEHRPARPGGPVPTTRRVAASAGVASSFGTFSDFHSDFIQSVDFLRLQVCQPFSSGSFSRLLGERHCSKDVCKFSEL